MEWNDNHYIGILIGVLYIIGMNRMYWSEWDTKIPKRNKKIHNRRV